VWRDFWAVGSKEADRFTESAIAAEVPFCIASFDPRPKIAPDPYSRRHGVRI
jgi:hypothetical protein